MRGPDPKFTTLGKAMGPFTEMHGGWGVITIALHINKDDVRVVLRADQEEKRKESSTRYRK